MYMCVCRCIYCHSLVNETFHSVVLEFFFSVLFEELRFVEVLNNEDNKLEGFDGTGSWCLISPYIRVKFCVCVCYYVIDTSNTLYMPIRYFSRVITQVKIIIGELVFECRWVVVQPHPLFWSRGDCPIGLLPPLRRFTSCCRSVCQPGDIFPSELYVLCTAHFNIIVLYK